MFCHSRSFPHWTSLFSFYFILPPSSSASLAPLNGGLFSWPLLVFRDLFLSFWLPWLVGWLVGWLGHSVGRSVALVGLSVGWLVGRSVVLLLGWSLCPLVMMYPTAYRSRFQKTINFSRRISKSPFGMIS